MQLWVGHWKIAVFKPIIRHRWSCRISLTVTFLNESLAEILCAFVNYSNNKGIFEYNDQFFVIFSRLLT